jgi:hypothetical protein
VTATKAPATTEAALQNQVIAMCEAFKLWVYHTHDSRRSNPGFPDLVILGTGGHMFRELKSATGKVTVEQQAWLDDLKAHAADADVWRPEDWRTGRIERELRALSDRSRRFQRSRRLDMSGGGS